MSLKYNATLPFLLDDASHKESQKEHGETIRIPKEKALGNYKRSATSKEHGSKSKTPLGEKLKDYCISALQERWEKKGIDADSLVKECEDIVRQNYLDLLKRMSDQGDISAKNADKAFRYLVKEEAKKRIDIRDMRVIRIPLQEFFGEIGSASIANAKKYRVPIGRIIKQISMLQESAWYEWSEIIVENGVVKERLSRASAIPRINFILSKEGIGRFRDIETLINTKTRDKIKYIEAVELQFDEDMVYDHILFTGQYTILHADMRKSLNFSYAFRLDEIIRSIMWQQNQSERPIYYNWKDLQKKFGVDYKYYKHFKQKVLIPAIEDLNQYSVDIEILLGEAKKGKERFVYFITAEKKKRADQYKVRGILFLSYYISCITWNTKTKNPTIEDIEDYGRHLEPELFSSDDGKILFGVLAPEGKELTVGEWKKRAQAAFDAHNNIMDNIDLIEKPLTERGYRYDPDRLALVDVNDKCARIGPLTSIEPVASLELIRFICPEINKVS